MVEPELVLLAAVPRAKRVGQNLTSAAELGVEAQAPDIVTIHGNGSFDLPGKGEPGGPGQHVTWDSVLDWERSRVLQAALALLAAVIVLYFLYKSYRLWNSGPSKTWEGTEQPQPQAAGLRVLLHSDAAHDPDAAAGAVSILIGTRKRRANINSTPPEETASSDPSLSQLQSSLTPRVQAQIEIQAECQVKVQLQGPVTQGQRAEAEVQVRLQRSARQVLVQTGVQGVVSVQIAARTDYQKQVEVKLNPRSPTTVEVVVQDKARAPVPVPAQQQDDVQVHSLALERAQAEPDQAVKDTSDVEDLVEDTSPTQDVNEDTSTTEDEVDTSAMEDETGDISFLEDVEEDTSSSSSEDMVEEETSASDEEADEDTPPVEYLVGGTSTLKGLDEAISTTNDLDDAISTKNDLDDVFLTKIDLDDVFLTKKGRV